MSWETPVAACGVGGRCEDGEGSYACVCEAGWIGEECGRRIESEVAARAADLRQLTRTDP